MIFMTTSRPLLLIVITLCLLLVSLTVFWMAAMPQQLLGTLKRSVAEQGNYALEATSPRLSFRDGLSLSLENVTLGNSTSASLSAGRMDIKLGLTSLFGGGIVADDVVLDTAVITLDVSETSSLPKLFARRLTLKESTLRLRDQKRLAVVGLSDVNGSLAMLPDGAVKADLTFLLADQLTSFVAEAENAERLFTTGSPADVSLSTPRMLISFSGQAKLSAGISLAGQSIIESGDAAALFRWLGMPFDALEGVGRFRLEGGVVMQNLSTQFDKFEARVGTESVTGTASISAGPDRINLAGEWSVPRLSLFAIEPLYEKPWNEKPFTIADVTAANLDLKLNVKQLRLRARDMGAVAVALKTEDQRLTVSMPRQPFATGEAEAAFVFTQDKGALTLDTKLDSKAIDANLILGGTLGLDAVQGPIDLNITTKQQGNSLADLISTTSGTMKLASRNLNVAGIDLTTRLSTLGSGWQASAGLSTTGLTLQTTVLLTDGIATLDQTTLKLGSVVLKPKGEVDVLRQALALQLSPKTTMTGAWTAPVVATGELPHITSAATPPAN
jgi:AsmA-like C-terminal region